MKSLEEYGLIVGDWVTYESILCSIAEAVDYPHYSIGHSANIKELIFSYLNQFQLVLESYDQLQRLLEGLNNYNANNSIVPEIPVTAYDLHSLDKNAVFRDYAYLFIISMHTLFDLMSCLVDAVVIAYKETKDDKGENKIDGSEMMTSLAHFGKWEHQRIHKPLVKCLKKFQNKAWVKKMSDIRHRIIHRGFHLSPMIGFEKSPELTFQLYRGVGFSGEEPTVAIGELFREFITGFPVMEKQLAETLLASFSELGGKQQIRTTYRFGRGARVYDHVGLEAID